MRQKTNPIAIFCVSLLFLCTLVFGQTAIAQQIIYVKADATGANNGTSWQNAFTQLQPAIHAAGTTDQIWVAAGTYYPTEQRIAGVNRSRSFVIPDYKDGVHIYGGFAGTETQLSQRTNPGANISRLSGDVDQNDKPQNIYEDSDRTQGHPAPFTLQATDHIVLSAFFNTNFGGFIQISDNANVYSVLSLGGGITRATVLDGLTISGGVAAEQELALYIEDEFFYSGGGLNCNGCSTTFRNVRFEGNYSMQYGGGVSIYNNGDPLFINSVFYGNGVGGDIPNNSQPVNTSAMQIRVELLFEGMPIDIFDLGGTGGAIHVASSANTEIINSTFFGNLSSFPGRQIKVEGNFTFRNSITWGSFGLGIDPGDDIIANTGSIFNSVLQTGCPTNVACAEISSSDPLLNDSLIITSASSSAVGRGDNSFLPADTDDLNGNGDAEEPLPFDAAGNPRIQGIVVDAGAFESPFEFAFNHSYSAVSPGQQQRLTYFGAGSTTSVTLNNTPVNDFTIENANQVRLTIPEGAESGLYRVVNNLGEFESSEEIIITDANGGGRALAANGSGFVEVPGDPAFRSNAISISFWMRVTDPNAFSGDIIRKGQGERTTFNLRANPNTESDQLTFQLGLLNLNNPNNPPVITDRLSSGSINVMSGSWHHVVTTYNDFGNGSQTIKLSVDGIILSRSVSNSAIATYFDPNEYSSIRIGNGNGFEIDNLMYWNRELSTGEMADLRLRHLSLSPFDPEANGLIASYRFDSDSADTVYDYAGRKNGAIVGGIARSAFSGAPVATTMGSTAGTSGATISLSNQDYEALMLGNPAEELLAGNLPGESYAFDVSEADSRRSPVSWFVVRNSNEPTQAEISYANIPALDNSQSLKVIYRPISGKPWELAPGNWVHDPAQRSFSLESARGLLPGEYSITNAPIVLLSASVSPLAQNAAPGENVQFTVTLRNTGADGTTLNTTAGINVQGLENISFSGGSVSGTTWTVPELEAGGSATLLINGTRASGSDNATLTASVSNPFYSVLNGGQTAQVFDPVYETGQHINITDIYLSAQPSPDVMGMLDSDFTMEGWIKRTDERPDNPILSQFNIQNTNTLRIGLINARPILEFNGSRLTAVGFLQAGIWYHLAFTFDKITGERKIFINGVQQASDVTDAGAILLNSPLIIGGWNSENNRTQFDGFKGGMHNLRIWNASLTREDILKRMHQHIPANDPLYGSLTADFRFTEGQGALAFDYAGGNLFTSPQNDIWNARGGVLFGTESAVAAVDVPASAGLSGASISASGVTEREVILHVSGRPDGPDRTPDDIGESYDVQLSELSLPRPNVTWSLKSTLGDLPQADLELAYGALSLADELPERLYVIHRTGPDQDWGLDPSWTHHPDTKTFTRSGSIQMGEYSIITVPTANLSLDMELISIGSPNEDSFELRFTATNTGIDTPTEATVTTIVSSLSAFTGLEADGSGFDPENLSWTISELAPGVTKILIISGLINDDALISLQSVITGSGVLNLASEEQISSSAVISKAPYGSGSALRLINELNTGATGNQLGLVNSSFTVEAWINPSVISGDQAILGQSIPENPNSRALHLILRNGKILMGFFTDDLVGQTDVPANTWSHIAFTYDVETNARVVYLNGVADGSNNATGPFLGEGNVYIGKWTDTAFLNGRIDELRIWNSARTEEEIFQNKHRTISVLDADFQNLNAYYRFDEGTGTVAHDIRNGFNADFAGNSVWETSTLQLGREAQLVSENGTGSAGDSGSTIEMESLTGGSATVYTYGNINAIRTSESPGEDFDALTDLEIQSRSAIVWGIIAEENPDMQVDLRIDYSSLQDTSQINQSPGLIFRTNAGAEWQLLPDSAWVRNVSAKTISYSGPLLAGEYSLAIVPFLSTTYTGNTAGWRMVGNPGSFARYSDVLSQVWTQGFPGSSQSETGVSNVYFYDEPSRSWQPPANAINIFGTGVSQGAQSVGKSSIVYFFEDEFPIEIRHTGIKNSGEVELVLNATVQDPDDGAQGWHLVSNPYPFAIDWTKVVATGLDEVAPPIFIFDASTFNGSGGYRVHYGFNVPGLPGDIQHDGILPPFQAFFIRTANIDGTPGTLTFKPEHASQNGGGQLYRPARTNRQIDEQSTPPISGLVFTVEDESGVFSASSLLKKLAESEEKALELPQPFPLTAPGITFGIQGETSAVLAMKSIAMEDGQSYEIPLTFEASSSGSYVLRIPNLEDWNSGIVHLTDHQTGRVTMLEAGSEYIFEHVAADPEPDAHPMGRKGRSLDAVQAESASLRKPAIPGLNGMHGAKGPEKSMEPRFTIMLSYQYLSHETGPELPREMELSQNYPNPFNPTTAIRYGLPEDGLVQLEVFNILGQRVAVLASGQQTAGYHQVQFDARRLASGVYIYRLRSGDTLLTRKMMLLK
ncbi:MAG: T9SS type A sorting domain-containing protein [Balneolales bacterium]|nr:T9SS type A sorting domain-containing protein [Balneolales bacterium]